MSQKWLVLVVAVLCLSAAQAQSLISVDEPKIQAFLRNGSTVVAIPVTSLASQPVTAELSLNWLNQAEKESGVVRRQVSIPPGQSRFETPLPLVDPSVWTRLRYTLAPERSAPVTSILALPAIAAHVFELKVSYAGLVRRGVPYTIHAEAVHPLTRQPLSGVEWSADALDHQLLAAKEEAGFAEFTITLPASADEEEQDENTVHITARLGDFVGSVRLTLPVFNHLSARIQSDKPIYQPGQTLHLRAVVSDPQGRAARAVPVTLRIDDQENQRVHTAQLVTSAYGIVQHDWTIPASAGLGQYQILFATEDEYYRLATHVVRVSRYELPAFRVTANPDRPAYSPQDQARVTITGAYLFGKPVPRGQVKIVRTNSPKEVVAQGEAAADGIFTTSLDLKSDHEDLEENTDQRFADLHFAAYYTDPQSHRTEQRRFDIRITREPIHVYLIRPNSTGWAPSPVYVSTSYADGRPAPAAVEIQIGGQRASFHTNRYGIGKTLLAQANESPEGAIIRATDAAGQSGDWEERYWPENYSLLRIETGRTLHRTGQSVTLTLTSPPDAPAEQSVLVHAIAADQRVATRVARLTNHRGEVTFPYQPEFRRTVVFLAWNAVDPLANDRDKVFGSRAVIFPDSSDLRVSAVSNLSTYKPGERASLRLQVTSADGQPVEAALGLAVVDQAVLERARTDEEFGHRPWFACAFCRDPGETEIGGVRLNDLYALKPSTPITPDLDLVAEALVANAGSLLLTEGSESIADEPQFSKITTQMTQVREALDRHYAASFELPENDAALTGALGQQWYGLLDPWGRPYTARFSVAGVKKAIIFRSSGLDKRLGTADDFTAGTYERPYFKPLEQIIEHILRTQEEYPATEAGFTRLLSENGLLLATLRDPWGTPYRAQLSTYKANRNINIHSAGPDRKFETLDDVTVAHFSGAYFQKEANQIAAVVLTGAQPPQSIDELRVRLSRAGIDLAGYRDAWGRPYRLTSVVSSRYSDVIQSKTVRIYGGASTAKTEVTPVTQKFITFALRSAGPDGLEQTYDDFDIARFPVLLSQESAAAPAGRPTTAALPGTATLSGVITDPAGAAILAATITLSDATGAAYEASSNEQGFFEFAGVPPGVYSLRANSPGFMPAEVSRIPLTAGQTTRVDIELRLGQMNQTVTVQAEAATVATDSASVSAAAPVATPRVREYFPETLLWLPEVITGLNGKAASQFPMADTITTWKVAAFASTQDGRAAETESEFRTFQPLFLDFDPPPVLTAGDQIEVPVVVRNYLDRAQQVNVTMPQAASRSVSVEANGSASLPYVLRATSAMDAIPQRMMVAGANKHRDAIEKSSRVHPDGQERVQTFGDLMVVTTSFAVTIPPAAIPGATRGELRLYPNLASLLLESASAILTTPHGCAEQTISAGFANLVAWRFARASGIANPKLERRALANIQLAVDSLSRFRDQQGGVRYWPTSEPDVAVTAYALNFLAEAAAAVSLDTHELLPLLTWLGQHQSEDGRWLPSHPDATGRQALLLTSTVARAAAAARKADANVPERMLAGAYHHLAQFTANVDEPYLLANFILAALDSGDESLVAPAVTRLAGLGREEQGGRYWDLPTNTPFYGWGTAGRYETTGCAVSALSIWRTAHPETAAALETPIRQGLLFLLRGRDASGNWYSTQSTVRAMRALADASPVFGNLGGQGGAVEIRANGRVVKTIALPSDPRATDPVLLDVSSYLGPGENHLSLTAKGGLRSALVRLSSSHWTPWPQAPVRHSPELRLAVQFDRLEAQPGQAVQCTVHAERVGFRGYGMLLAEIGLPPGAEVDRSSLQSVVDDYQQGVDHYEILPDRVVLYLSPKAGASQFTFGLTPRLPMQAKSAASIVYDYYNPEAAAEVPPSAWRIK